MKNLFISKWWGNYIGGCDDSFLLLDYFGTSPSSTWTLRQIFEDIHLDSILESGEFENSDLYFELKPGYEPHFDMTIDVVIDLSAILLECLHNKQVAMKELDESTKYQKDIIISASKQDILLLKSGLEKFINAHQSFDLANLMNENDLTELICDCKAVRDELNVFTN